MPAQQQYNKSNSNDTTFGCYSTQASFSVIVVDDPSTAADSNSGADGTGEDDVGAMFGATKEVIRMSEDLVEAAFDGEIDEVQAQLDKGYHPESCDEHDQVLMISVTNVKLITVCASSSLHWYTRPCRLHCRKQHAKDTMIL